MKVILLKDVQNLGNAGDIRIVADGYARNFLIPGGYAKIATEATIKQAEELRAKKEREAEEKLKKAEKMAEALEGALVTIKAKADKSGRLFAAVKSDEISKALAKKGFDVHKDKITIAEPIKEVGEHEVNVNLDYGLEAKITVVVESDG